ncbi:MAG: hypothetical protein CW742_06880, partial [Methanoregula sp.]
GAFTSPLGPHLPAADVTVYSVDGSRTDTALFMGRSTTLWGNSGDLAVLRDGRGTVIDTLAEGAGA